MKAIQKSRNRAFDFIKIVATFLIVLHHYQQVKNITFNGINFYGGHFNFGWIVELFFVLSGYFMAVYREKIQRGLTFIRFYLKRFLRLFPLMSLSVVIYEILYFIRLIIVPNTPPPGS